MRTPLLLAFLACALCALAPTKFTPPVLGIVRDAKRELRVVNGLSGTFILQKTIAANTINWAFDGKAGLVATDSELLTLGPGGTVIRHDAMRRNAVIGPGSAFFPETNELWVGQTRVPIGPGTISGEVVAIEGTELAMCRETTLWLLTVDIKTGAVLHEFVPGGAVGKQACLDGTDPLVLTPDRMLLAAGPAVLVQTAAGVERSIPVSATHLARAGGDWIEVETAGRPAHLIRMTPEGEQVYALPGREAHP